MIAFGPIPSRRLGRSLGINHLPFKICTYACSYCQVGPTLQMRIERREFLSTAEIRDAVAEKVRKCKSAGESIDHLTFVPDGEPTLDTNLGAHIRALADIGIPVAVMTNASLLWMPEVRAALAAADLVSVKVDTTRPETWHRLDRPHGELDLERILDGIRAFAREYAGTLISETMLVGSVNESEADLAATGAFLAEIAPARAYLGIPTRPPACPDVLPPSNLALVRAYEIVSGQLDGVELLPVYESGAFGVVDNPIESLLGILAVHPMREAAILSYLAEAGFDIKRLETLVSGGLVDRVQYLGDTFFVRRMSHPAAGTPRAGRHAS